MKKTQRNSYFAGIRLLMVLALAAVFLIVGFIVWQTRPTRVVTKKQVDLIAGIESRNAARIRRLTSEHYKDKWGFDRSDAAEAVVDVGSQFLTLVLTPEDQQLFVEKGEAVISVRFTVSGNAVGPVGGEVTRRINQLDEPFLFTWKKESFLPSSWRLIQIHQEELPEELYGYEPGDIRRRMNGE